MPVYNWPDPEEERRAIEREKARRRRVESYRSTSTASQAHAVAQMTAYYPTMSAGVAVPLALSGANPRDPAIAQLATAEAKATKRKKGIWGRLGDITMSPIRWGADRLDDIGEIAGDVARPVSRYGLAGLMAPFEAGTGVLRNVAAAGGEILGGAASGAVTGAGLGLATFTPWGVAAGAVGGALAGAGAGAMAQAKGVDVEGDFVNPISQTTLGQDIFGGKEIGQGYLPSGSAAVAQAESSRAAASIGGHAFTPGRLLAASAFDVDTAPYKILSGAVDLANAWKLDPAYLAGVGVSRRATNIRRFGPQIEQAEDAVRQGAGLIDHGANPGILYDAAQRWLTADRRGMGFTEWARQTDDFETIRRAIPGIDPNSALELADARTTDQVLAALLPRTDAAGAPKGLMLERGLVERPAVSGAIGRAKVRYSNLEIRGRRPFGSRLFAEMPGGEIDLLDPAGAVENFSNLQRTAKIPADQLSANNRRLAERLRDGDRKGAIRAVTEPFVGPSGPLQRAGAPPEMAKKMQRLLLSTMDDLERKAFFEQGLGTRVSAMDIAGESFELAAPSIITDEVGSIMKIDRTDVRAMRRATSTVAPLWNHPIAGPMAKGSIAFLDGATSAVWKPFVLFRGAYTVRVIAEEQIRMANAGVDSLFAHPLSYLAWMASDSGRMGKHLEKLGVTVRRGDVDVLGKAFTEAPSDVERILRGHANEFSAALGRKAIREHWMKGHTRQTTDRNWYRGEKNYNSALTEKLATMHGDPILRRIAHGDLLPEDPRDFRTGQSAIRHWLETGEGAEVRKVVGGLTSPTDVDDMLSRGQHLVDDVIGATVKKRPAPAALAGGTGVRPPGGTPAAMSIGGDPRLRQAVATGEIDGVPMFLDNGKINPEFRTKVDEIVDEGAGPVSVLGSDWSDPTLVDMWDQAVEKGFNLFMGNRTAKLSRSPHFRQYYWREAERLAFTLNPEDQARLLANMDKAELPAAMKESIRASAARGTGDLKLEQVDTLLKGRALDATKELLYDVHKKGQLSDVLRILWPFAEAQKEVMTTWARLATRGLPKVPRRAHQILEGGKGEAGVFYTDEQTGELMFTYPGSRILTEKAFGVPIPLGNRVEGLSMFGSGIMPGFGPAIQLSARWFLPDKPQFDQVREIIDPFGESAEGGAIEQFGPGWLKAIITGINMDASDSAFGNDMMDIFNAGLTSGMYRNDTPEAIRDGLESAKSKARYLHLIRGAAMAGGAPAPPRPEFLAADKDGRWMMMDSLVKEYRKLWEEHPEDASALFVEKFGPNVFSLVQPSTYAGGKILPDSTRVAGDWARNNPGIAEKYPAIYGLFAPSDPESTFDIAVWARQRRTGERVPMDPDQRAKYNNDKLASTIYYSAKDRFGPFPNAAARRFLSTLNDALVKEYPGYQENIGLPEKVNTEQRINELSKAVEDPDLAGNPVTAPIKLYLRAREVLNTYAQESGLAESVAKAKSTAGARAWLRNFGIALTNEYPAFAQSWDRVFEPELVDDTATATEEERMVSA